MANYPVGATQQKVLNALGMTATDFQEAEKVFESIGIEVSSKRVGRTTEPVVRVKSQFVGGWNAGGAEKQLAKSRLTVNHPWFPAPDRQPSVDWSKVPEGISSGEIPHSGDFENVP